jgi:hypothetical protein
MFLEIASYGCEKLCFCKDLVNAPECTLVKGISKRGPEFFVKWQYHTGKFNFSPQKEKLLCKRQSLFQ